MATTVSVVGLIEKSKLLGMGDLNNLKGVYVRELQTRSTIYVELRKP